MACVRSKMVATVAIAFAVSWGFHLVEKRTDQRLEREHRVLECVVSNTAHEQLFLQPGERVPLLPILDKCEKLRDKR